MRVFVVARCDCGHPEVHGVYVSEATARRVCERLNNNQSAYEYAVRPAHFYRPRRKEREQ